MADTNNDRDKIRGYLEQFRDDWEADKHNREDALDDLRFVAGDQWDQDEKAARESEGRPTLTINRLPQFARQVEGDLRNIKPSIKVRPNGYGSDDDMAEVFNGIIRNIEERSKDEQPYTVAVGSAIRCGIGHFRIVTDNLDQNPFSQDIFIKPIHNPLAVVWDHSARSIVRADANHCFVRESVPKKEFEKEYKGAKVLDFGDKDLDEVEWYWVKPDQVLISEFFKLEDDKAPFALLENGSIIRMDRIPQSMQHNTDRQSMVTISGEEIFIEDIRDGKIKKCTWKKISGAETLDEGEWPTQHIPIIPVIGEETHFEGQASRASLIRWAKDPQRQYNFWRSTQTEVIGASPKAPYIIGVSQIEGFEELWQKANKGNKATLAYNDQQNPNRPSREMPPTASSGMNNEIALAAEDMKATTGIYDAALGAQSNETSGVAIRQRQTEGDISTNFFGDNLAASMQRAGRIIMDLVPIVYDTRRTMRIVAEDSSSELQEVNAPVVENGVVNIHNDLTVGEYDVTVDIGPSYSTKRQEALEGMRDVLQGQPFAQYFMDLIARNADWPGNEEFAERAKKMLPPELRDEDEEVTPEQQQQLEQQAQLAQMQLQLEMQKAQSDLQEQTAKTEKTLADAEGVELDNLMKRLDLSTLTGQVQQAVLIAIQQALAAPPNQPVSPQEETPPSAGFFNA